MSETLSKQDKATHIIRWIARIWSIVIIGLGVLVFIAEIIESFSMELEPYPYYENLIPLTLFLGVAGLAISWRREGLGGTITVVSICLNFIVYLFTGRSAVGMVLLILTPILIPGILFLVCWLRTQKMWNLC